MVKKNIFQYLKIQLLQTILYRKPLALKININTSGINFYQCIFVLQEKMNVQ